MMEPAAEKQSVDNLGIQKTKRRIALDTEFVWQSTYSAKLGLVQAAPSGGAMALAARESDFIRHGSREPRHAAARLIDPLACGGAEMALIVADSEIEKIFHAADQDLAYITRWCGARFNNIFDTSLAARFCGATGQVSLQKLAAETLGVELRKDSTLTNWLKRPLSPKQLAYALDDVAYLAELADRLVEKARAAGTLGWMRAAMLEFEAEAQTPEPPGGAWRRIKRIRPEFFKTPRQLVLLRELAEARERLAARADLPRGWVMDDAALCAAASRPGAFSWADAAKDIPQNLAPEMEAAFQRALAMPPEDLPSLPGQRPQAPKERIEQVREAVALCARRHGVDPAVIGTRALCADYAAASADAAHKFNTGWRREILAGAL